MANIVFTTCHEWPVLSASDAYVAQALEALGHHIVSLPWNDDFARFQAANLIVLRANWDYHHHIQAFSIWLDKVAAQHIPIQNPTHLVQWNLHKGYLIDLQQKGITIPTSVIYQPGDDLEPIYQRHHWFEAVIKPVYGASGHRVARVAYHEIPTWMQQYGSQVFTDTWLVQQFMPEIQQQGELSIVFLEGEYAHAIQKVPQAGEFRVNSQYRGQLKRVQPKHAIIEQAHAVLLKVQDMPLYARVDGVVTADRRFCLLELEINEPGLYFEYAPEQARRFAEVIHAKLQ